MASKLRKRIRLVWMLSGLCFMSWVFINMQAYGVDPHVTESDDVVVVHVSDDVVTFQPVDNSQPVALIFYPGAMVQPKAYFPMARVIAESGFEVRIIKLPFRLAPFESHQMKVFELTRSQISGDTMNRKWVVGGHSKGGALAAQFAGSNEIILAGLLLIGTSHPREYSLASLKLDISKIYGTEDGLASREEVERYKDNLPADAHFQMIEGANHRQFGYYGYQLGDQKATITRDEQQRQTAVAIIDQLTRIQSNTE